MAPMMNENGLHDRPGLQAWVAITWSIYFQHSNSSHEKQAQSQALTLPERIESTHHPNPSVGFDPAHS
jgi:hypothetical protein